MLQMEHENQSLSINNFKKMIKKLSIADLEAILSDLVYFESDSKLIKICAEELKRKKAVA